MAGDIKKPLSEIGNITWARAKVKQCHVVALGGASNQKRAAKAAKVALARQLATMVDFRGREHHGWLVALRYKLASLWKSTPIAELANDMQPPLRGE